MDDLLKKKNTVTIPKSILPDVQQFEPEPPQPLTATQYTKSSTDSDSEDDDDTDNDADESSFAGTLDSAISETSVKPRLPKVQNIPTPFLMAERRKIKELPDPTELSAQTSQQSITALQSAFKVSFTTVF
jgi:hypothetical protein